MQRRFACSGAETFAGRLGTLVDGYRNVANTIATSQQPEMAKRRPFATRAATDAVGRVAARVLRHRQPASPVSPSN